MPDSLMHSAIKLLLALPAVILLAYISLRLSNKYLYGQNQSKQYRYWNGCPYIINSFCAL